MNEKRVLAVHSNHQLYYSIARGNLAQARAVEKEIADREHRYLQEVEDDIQRTGRPDPDYAGLETASRIRLWRTRCQHTMQAVVFSALAVEAFINYYAVRKSSSSYFKNYLDNLNPVQKWFIVPQLFNSGRGLERGKEPLQGLEFLFRLRNDLVHAKPKTAVTLDEKGFHTEPILENYYDPSIDTADRCVSTVSDLVKSLHRIDSGVQTAWLEEEGFWRHFDTITKHI